MKAKKWLLSIVVLIILGSNVMFTSLANAYEKLYDGKMITYLLEEGDSEELPDNMEKQMISLANLYNYKDYKVENYRVVLLKEGDFIYVLQGNNRHSGNQAGFGKNNLQNIFAYGNIHSGHVSFICAFYP